ncbi:MAG: hypothetical protein PVJ00_00685 [Desulfobacterales bacterium]
MAFQAATVLEIIGSAPYETEAAAGGALHHGLLEVKVRKNLA